MKGDKVKVVRGRKVPIGTEGIVIWVGEGRWGTRLGVKDAAGEVHWTAASNVELLETAANSPGIPGVPMAAPFAAPAWAFKGAMVTMAETVTDMKSGVTIPAGSSVEVFWIGEDRREPGKARVGVKLCGHRGYGRAPAVFAAESEIVEGTALVAEVA